MKEYKYKINGNNYNVSVGDIVDNIAEVMVNGMPYKVELENKQTSKRSFSTTPFCRSAHIYR